MKPDTIFRDAVHHFLRRFDEVISDFEPALWWPLYVATQAQAHHVVMRAFAASLARSRLEASPERLGA